MAQLRHGFLHGRLRQRPQPGLKTISCSLFQRARLSMVISEPLRLPCSEPRKCLLEDRSDPRNRCCRRYRGPQRRIRYPGAPP